jgi:RHS repeat-associated protein
MTLLTIKGATTADDVMTQYFHDDYGTRIKVIDAEGNSTEMGDFDVMGNSREQEDALGHIRKVTFNAAGWPLESESALGFKSVMTYDKLGNRKTSEMLLENNQRAMTQYRYDDLDRLIETEDPLGGITQQVYDAEGRMIESLDARAVKTTMAYDSRGRMESVTDGNGNITQTEYLDGVINKRIYPTYEETYLYDERNRQIQVEQVLSETVRYTSVQRFDPVGNLVASTDAKGRSSQRFYDALNRLTKEIDPTLGETIYRYDFRDNLLSVTDAKGNTHTFTYDKLNRKLTEARPMGQTIRYAYDAIGQLTLRTSPNGAKRQYSYDADNRLIKEEHFLPPTTPPASNPAPSKVHDYTYFADSRGLLKSYADGKTSGSYTYDLKGQKLNETITFATDTPNPISKTLERSYEANGLLKTLTYPGSTGTSTFAYDTNNQLKTYKIPGLATGNDTLTYSYRWNAISEVTMPGNLKRTVTLDALQRPTKIEVKGYGTSPGNNGAPVMNHRYQYDEVSNISKKTSLDGDYAYDYDDLDRLTKAEPPVPLRQSPENPDGLPVEGFSYDAVHNRESSAHQPGAWIYNANNELTQWGQGMNKRQLTYDANGSTIKEQQGNPVTETTDYVYDAQDRLVEVKKNAVTVAKYAYDPMGRRVWREAGSQVTWFLYSDEGLIEELSSITNTIRTYGWNPGGLWGTDTVWQKDANGTFLTNNDHLYTTDVLTKAEDGAVAWSGLREAFGKTQVGESAQTQYLLRFPGQWEDEVTGLHQNWWREYKNDSGGYPSLDPLFSVSRDSFTYAGQNPISVFDAMGLFSSKFGYERHKQITEVAYRRTSPCVAADEETIKWSNDYDMWPGSQAIDNAYTHAMTPADSIMEAVAPGNYGGSIYKKRFILRISRAEARSRWLGFIWENVASCTPMGLGFALHALQDSFSHGHAGFEPWDGGFTKHNIPTPDHIWVDTVIDYGTFNRAVEASAELIKAQAKLCRSNCKCD